MPASGTHEDVRRAAARRGSPPLKVDGFKLHVDYGDDAAVPQVFARIFAIALGALDDEPLTMTLIEPGCPATGLNTVLLPVNPASTCPESGPPPDRQDLVPATPADLARLPRPNCQQLALAPVTPTPAPPTPAPPAPAPPAPPPPAPAPPAPTPPAPAPPAPAPPTPAPTPPPRAAARAHAAAGAASSHTPPPAPPAPDPDGPPTHRTRSRRRSGIAGGRRRGRSPRSDVRIPGRRRGGVACHGRHIDRGAFAQRPGRAVDRAARPARRARYCRHHQRDGPLDGAAARPLRRAAARVPGPAAAGRRAGPARRSGRASRSPANGWTQASAGCGRGAGPLPTAASRPC